MSEALCRCGHTTTEHVRVMDPATCTKCNCNHLSTRHDSHTPPPTREPIRLTGEAEANVLVEALADPNLQEALADLLYARYGFDSFTDAYRVACRANEVLTARAAGGPTLADAWREGWLYARSTPGLAYDNPYRTPESEDTE